jgi:FixJ family two-component response regulator
VRLASDGKVAPRSGELPQSCANSGNIVEANRIDDASVRVATNRLVRSLGYIAHTFSSADEFLQSSLVNDTWCVIADVQMPGTSGVELQSILLAQGRRQPIIFITAFPEESTRARALKAGAICFLSKPFDGPTLIKYLAAAIENADDAT